MGLQAFSRLLHRSLHHPKNGEKQRSLLQQPLHLPYNNLSHRLNPRSRMILRKTDHNSHKIVITTVLRDYHLCLHTHKGYLKIDMNIPVIGKLLGECCMLHSIDNPAMI
jgi:hypothetical protein